MIVERIPDKPAQPLAEGHYALFLAHCQKRLSPYFDSVLPALHLEASQTHTILELYVGSPEMSYNINWRGEDKGKLLPQDPTAEETLLLRADFGDSPAKNAWKDSEEGKALARWIDLGGVEWPCFQLDLYLTLPHGVHFAQFVKSYETIQHILRPLIRLLYPRVYLADSGLEFHFTPFTGYPTKINLILTRSPEELCHWLGLDFGMWQEGFKAPEDVWDWILSVKASSGLAKVLRRVKGGEKPFEGGRPGRQEAPAEKKAWEEFAERVKEGDFDWETAPAGETKGKKARLLAGTRANPHAKLDLINPRELDEVAKAIVKAFEKEEELREKIADVKAYAEGDLSLAVSEACDSSCSGKCT